jgi:hypothetical protein
MSGAGGSLLLLLVAILLLYLAVTDRLSRLLDGIDVALGKKKVGDAVASNAIGGGNVTFQLPSLPSLGNNAQVNV